MPIQPPSISSQSPKGSSLEQSSKGVVNESPSPAPSLACQFLAMEMMRLNEEMFQVALQKARERVHDRQGRVPEDTAAALQELREIEALAILTRIVDGPAAKAKSRRRETLPLLDWLTATFTPANPFRHKRA